MEDKAGKEDIVEALSADKKARATYDAYLALVFCLTIPLAYPDLRKQLAASDRGMMNVPAEGIYFFPPSHSHEIDLVKKLYGSRPIPEGFSPIDEIVRRIDPGGRVEAVPDRRHQTLGPGSHVPQAVAGVVQRNLGPHARDAH